MLPLGNHPGNTGGKKGRSGRPPNWLRDWCDDLLAKPENKAQVEGVLNDSKHGAYSAMWKAIAERAHGKPIQPMEHSGGVEVVVRRALK